MDAVTHGFSAVRHSMKFIGAGRLRITKVIDMVMQNEREALLPFRLR
jgi:hypothetical protein